MKLAGTVVFSAALMLLFAGNLHAETGDLDCTDPLSYGQSFDRLKACRSHTPRYETYKGQRVRVGAEMMVCEVEQEIMLYEVIEKYCQAFSSEFPDRIANLRGEVQSTASFARSILIQIEGVEDFLSSTYADDSIAERVFAEESWLQAREILEMAPVEMFEQKKISLQILSASGDLKEVDDYKYEWSGWLGVRLYRNVGDALDLSLVEIARRQIYLSMELGFDPERANEISPLGVYVTSFDVNRQELVEWVVSQINW